MTHYFELKLTDVPRNTTKKQWKEISRYLRICGIEVEKELPLENVLDFIINTLTGEATIQLCKNKP